MHDEQCLAVVALSNFKSTLNSALVQNEVNVSRLQTLDSLHSKQVNSLVVESSDD